MTPEEALNRTLERVLHDNLRDIADDFARNHGIVLKSASFEWLEQIGEPPVVSRVEVWSVTSNRR